MSQNETNHEAIQTDHDQENDLLPGENVASTVDGSGQSDDSASPISDHSPIFLSDAKRYRKRAQAAEKELQELKISLAEREKTMQEQSQTILSMKQQQEVAALLQKAGVIDQDAARVLVENAMKQCPQTNVEQAVNELQRSKPYLFRQGTNRIRGASGAMSARETAYADRSPVLESAAEAAMESGKRIDVLRYLRLRRQSRRR